MTAPAPLPVIASFWFGSDLTWVEALCIQSFLDRGHRFVLYTAGPLEGVPDGVERRPAADIFWPPPFDLGTESSRTSLTTFSDMFRMRMIQKTGFLWVDLDAYCVRPFDFGSPWVFCKSPRESYPNGILGLPPDSVTLTRLLWFMSLENPIQPWRARKFRRRMRERIRNGERWSHDALPWGTTGPKALKHWLESSGEDAHALPYEALYALEPDDLYKLHAFRVPTSEIERDGVHSVHIYGHQKIILLERYRGLPSPGSYLDRLCCRHGINPKDLPIRPQKWMEAEWEAMCPSAAVAAKLAM